MSFYPNYLLNYANLALGRQPARPLLFSYYITARCPMVCHTCGVGGGNPFKDQALTELNTPETMKLIAMLGQVSDTLDLGGGEPMLRSDLEALLEHARHCGLRTVLNTKGIGLANRPDLMRADVLVLSIDSLNARKLASLYGCSETIAGEILNALDVALTLRSGSQAQVVLSSVATPDNLEDVLAVLAFATRHKLGFHLTPQIEGTRVHPDLHSNTAYIKLLEAVIANKKAGCNVLGTRQYLESIRDFRQFRCYPLLMPVIRPDGHLLYPCQQRATTSVSILEAGSYADALRRAQRLYGPLRKCRDCCHNYSHMSLSLLQRRPLQAWLAGRQWAAIAEKESHS